VARKWPLLEIESATTILDEKVRERFLLPGVGQIAAIPRDELQRRRVAHPLVRRPGLAPMQTGAEYRVSSVDLPPGIRKDPRVERFPESANQLLHAGARLRRGQAADQHAVLQRRQRKSLFPRHYTTSGD
jgi:hypothetical protein